MEKASGAVVLLVGMLLVASLAGSAPDVKADVPFHVDGEESSAGGAAACCKNCACTRSIPPQCRCTDVSTSCYSGCERCPCTKSIPPQCRCVDVKPFCPKRCAGAAGSV